MNQIGNTIKLETYTRFERNLSILKFGPNNTVDCHYVFNINKFKHRILVIFRDGLKHCGKNIYTKTYKNKHL